MMGNQFIYFFRFMHKNMGFVSKSSVIRIFIFLLISTAINIFIPQTIHADNTPPSPTNLSVESYNRSYAKLVWDFDDSGISGFKLQRREDNGDYKTISTPRNSIRSYNDYDIDNGHSYTYRICTYYKNEYSEYLESDILIYIYPVSLTTESISTTEINLQWEYENSSFVYRYDYKTVIERKQGGQDWTIIAEVPKSKTEYVDTGLATGVKYYYRVRSMYNDVISQLYYPSNTTGATEYTMLGTPTDLSFTWTEYSRIELNWTDNSSNESYYRIERRTDDRDFVQVGSIGKNKTNFTDSNTSNGHKYTYRVYCTNGNSSSGYSTELVVYYIIPVSLSLSPVSSDRIDLEWSYKESSFINDSDISTVIERRNSNTSEWLAIKTTVPGVMNFSDNGLYPDTLYYYRIRAVYNNQTVDIPYPDDDDTYSTYTKISTPTGFYGFSYSGTQISLHWDDSKSSGQYYSLQRMNSEGDFENISSRLKEAEYIDKNLAELTEYKYRLRVYSSHTSSNYTEEITIITEALPAPEKLEAEVVNNNYVLLRWDYDYVQETGFEIWRKENENNAWELYDFADKNMTDYIDRNITSETTYSYRIRAIKEDYVYSSFSETLDMGVIIPVQPVRLAWMIDAFDNISLSWIDLSSNETGFIIEYRRNINESWNTLIELPKNTQRYAFIPDNQKKECYFRVRAYRSDYMTYSSSDEIFIPSSLPPMPKSFRIAESLPGLVKLSWEDAGSSEEGFRIFRREEGAAEFELIDTTMPNITFFTDSSIKENTFYEYRMCAYNGWGISPYTGTAGVQTPKMAEIPDLDGYSWAENDIGYLIMEGFLDPDTSGFLPDSSVTRAEYVKLLIESYGVPMVSVGSFPDVSPQNPYYSYIMTSAYYGIVSIPAKNPYNPDKNISRQEMVYFAYNTLESLNINIEEYPLDILSSYTDKDLISDYAASAFCAFAGKEIITGNNINELNPQHEAGISELASFFKRLLEVYPPKNTAF